MLLFQGKMKDGLKLGCPCDSCSQSGLCKPGSLVKAEAAELGQDYWCILPVRGTVLRVKGAEEVLPEATGCSPSPSGQETKDTTI